MRDRQADRWEHVGFGQQDGLEGQFRIDEQLPQRRRQVSGRRGGGACGRRRPGGLAGPGERNTDARLGREDERVNLLAQRLRNPFVVQVAVGARCREILEPEWRFRASGAVVVKVVDQGRGDDARAPVPVQQRQSRQVQRAEHHFEEVPAVVIAALEAGAGAVVDGAGDGGAGPTQGRAGADPDALHRQRVSLLKAIPTRSDPLEAGHDLGPDSRGFQRRDDREGRPGEVFVVRRRHRASGTPRSLASASMSGIAASKS